MGSKVIGKQLRRCIRSGRLNSAVINAVQPLEKRILFTSIGNLESTYGQTSHTGVTIGYTGAGDPTLQIVEMISQPGMITPAAGSTYAKNFSTANGYTFLVSDGTGAAEVYKDTVAGYVPTVGDTIQLTGNWSPFSQLPEIATVTAISKTGTAAVPAPVTTTISTINPSGTTAAYTTSPTEPYSVTGYPLLLQNVTISGISGTFTNGSQNAVVTDSGGNAMVLYTSAGGATSEIAYSDLVGAAVPTAPVNIIGYVEVFKSGSNYTPEFYPNTIGAPVVSGLSISAGPTAGTNSVTIQGFGFASATGVSFGGTAATSFSISSTNTDEVISAVVPAHSAATVDVTVTGPTGTSAAATADKYTYTNGPAISSISPIGGQVSGGTVITISGWGFSANDTVSINGSAGTNVSYNPTAGTLTASTPANAIGTYDVRVTDTSTSLVSPISATDAYSYAPPPVITSVQGWNGSAAVPLTTGIDSGGNMVLISGTNFINPTAVSFGSVAATSFTYNASNSTIVAISPPQANGSIAQITVTTAGGGISSGSTFYFTYGLTTIAGTESQTLATNSVFTIDTNPTITQILEIAGGTVSDINGNTERFIYTSFYIQDSTGSEDVFGANSSSGSPSLPGSYMPVTGNTISITAVEAPYLQTPEIGTVTAISTTGASTNYAPVVPVVATIPQVDTAAPLPAAYDGYIVTIKGVYISGLETGGVPLTSFALNETTTGGLITDPSGNSMSLYYATTYNQASITGPGDSAFAGSIVGNLDGASVPTGHLVDVTGWVDINNSGVTELNLLSITNPSTVAPGITSLSPNQGPPGGTTPVTITGYGFLNINGTPTVSFGGNPGTNIQVINDNQLTVTAPASTLGTTGHLGTVNVTVTNPANQVSNAVAYTYTLAPVVSAVSPGGASTTGTNASGGAQSVVITGTGFTNATNVSFGSVVLGSGSFVVNSDTQITVTQAPPHAAGSVDVTVTAPASGGGSVTSSTSAVDKFIYDSIPTVTVSPASGADSGGTTVTLTGSSLLGTSAVYFGTLPATSFSYNATTGAITAVAPAQALGKVVNVTVTNYAGTSASAASNQFTYTATTVAFAQNTANGVFVTIDSNPVITAILSQPGTVNGETYPYYAFLINDGTGSEDVFYAPSRQNNSSVANFVPVVGNTITVTGDISDFRQIDEMGGSGNNVITAIANTGTAAVPAPIPETVSAVNISTIPQGTGFGSHLITLSNVTVTGQNGNVTPTSTANGTLTMNDSTGSMTLFVYTTSYSTTNEQFAGAPFPAGPETLTGFVYVFTSGSSNTAEFVPVLDNSTIPAWLAPSSLAIFNPTEKTLYVNGASTIIADPGTDNPLILAPNTVNTASVLNIAVPSVGHQIHISGLNLTAGASVHMNTSSSTPVVLVDSNTQGLTIDATSTLDISNNFMDIAAGNLTTVTTLVQQGYNGGLWSGNGGITSSTAAANPSHLTAVGVILNANSAGGTLYSTFDGATTGGATDVLLRYTYYGDSNLDGKVDGSDYSRIDSGVLTNASGWFNGDFNYDTSLDGSDYTLLDNAYNTQAAAFAGPSAEVATSSSAHSAVPPVTLTTDSTFSKKKVKHSLFDDLVIN